MEQSWRTQAFAGLKRFQFRVLVCTDLMARGIDAEHVDVVVNLNLPVEKETYLHRSGRTARFGSVGWMVSLVFEGEEAEHLEFFQKQLGFELVDFADREAAMTGKLQQLNLQEADLGPTREEIERFPQLPFPTPDMQHHHEQGPGLEPKKSRSLRPAEKAKTPGAPPPRRTAPEMPAQAPQAQPAVDVPISTALPSPNAGPASMNLAGLPGMVNAGRPTGPTNLGRYPTSSPMATPSRGAPGPGGMPSPLAAPPVLLPPGAAAPQVSLPMWESWMLNCSLASYWEKQGNGTPVHQLSSSTRERLDALWHHHRRVWIGA
eukprot:symbB.v1.2.003329.t1/scaffold171.1/size348550/6